MAIQSRRIQSRWQFSQDAHNQDGDSHDLITTIILGTECHQPAHGACQRHRKRTAHQKAIVCYTENKNKQNENKNKKAWWSQAKQINKQKKNKTINKNKTTTAATTTTKRKKRRRRKKTSRQKWTCSLENVFPPSAAPGVDRTEWQLNCTSGRITSVLAEDEQRSQVVAQQQREEMLERRNWDGATRRRGVCLKHCRVQTGTERLSVW